MAQGATETWKLTLTGGFRSTRVVTPEGLRPAAVLVKEGKIIEVADWGSFPASAHLRDYGDNVLMPGLVDTHVHINEPGRTDWEGFKTATQAAAAGGVTTLVDMPLNCLPETISVAALEAKRAAAAGQVWVDWMAWGGVVGNDGVGGNEANLPPLINAGVPGFKCFLVHSGIDTFAWADEAQLRKTLAVLRGSGLPLLAHAELAGPVDRAIEQINSGEALSGETFADWRRYGTYLASRPDEAELEAIELLIGLAAVFDTPIHIVHLATARALPALKRAREIGLKITVETCPQYLWFAAEEIPDGATEFKCAPPIRSVTNREALWQGLLDGAIDMIATDHSPCPPEMKNREMGRFDQVWGGIASLGLALPVVWTGLSQRGGDLELLTRWLAAEPARLAGLSGRKGALEAGCDADLVVFDPDAEWTVTGEDLRFRHKISPYVGARLRGRVLETYLRGERIFGDRRQDGAIDPRARGEELRRTI
jgi:allantoinase